MKKLFFLIGAFGLSWLPVAAGWIPVEKASVLSLYDFRLMGESNVEVV
jgi:hypothetical protein